MSDRTALIGCVVCVVCIFVEAIAAVAMATSSPRMAARVSATSATACMQAHRTNAHGGSRSRRCCESARKGAHPKRRCRAIEHARTPGTSTHSLPAHPGGRAGAGVGAGSTQTGQAGGSGNTPARTGSGASPGSGSTGSSEAGGARGEPGSSAPGESGAPSESAPPSGPAHVQVTAEDTDGYRFILSRTSVPAGEVVIEFVNHGQDEHNLHAVESTAGTEAGSLPNTAPGGHPQLKLDLRPGSYTLFCSLPGHEAKGMKATLTVQ